jgi:hypothetical protein
MRASAEELLKDKLNVRKPLFKCGLYAICIALRTKTSTSDGNLLTVNIYQFSETLMSFQHPVDVMQYLGNLLF